MEVCQNHLKTAHSADQRDRTVCLDAGSFERYLYQTIENNLRLKNNAK